MLDKFGVKGTIDYVKSAKPIREHAKILQESGQAGYGDVLTEIYKKSN